MLHRKIYSTIELIEDVSENQKIENENSDMAKKNSIFFDSLKGLLDSIQSYAIAKKNFDFSLDENTEKLLKDLISYSKNVFDNEKVVNPKSFKQKSDTFIELISKEWNDFYKEENGELKNELNIIALVHPNSSEVKNCIIALNRCGKWPLTLDNITWYEKAKKSADEFIKEIRFDNEIKEFLIKVRDKKATLADISPLILEWIKLENIAEKITLNIKNIV